jgi:hypothetical protein
MLQIINAYFVEGGVLDSNPSFFCPLEHVTWANRNIPPTGLLKQILSPNYDSFSRSTRTSSFVATSQFLNRLIGFKHTIPVRSLWHASEAPSRRTRNKSNRSTNRLALDVTHLSSKFDLWVCPNLPSAVNTDLTHSYPCPHESTISTDS